MKKLLIKLGLWEEPRNLTIAVISGQTLVDDGWYQTALKHYCGACERWFKDTRGTGAHQRLVHEGIFRKDRSKNA